MPDHEQDAVVILPALAGEPTPQVLVAGWIAGRDRWLADANALEITDQESYEYGMLLLQGALTERHRLQKARKAAKEPWLEGGRTVDRTAKQLLGPLEKGERGLKDRAASWAREQEAERRRKEREIQDQQRRAAKVSDAAAAEARDQAEAKGEDGDMAAAMARGDAEPLTQEIAPAKTTRTAYGGAVRKKAIELNSAGTEYRERWQLLLITAEAVVTARGTDLRKVIEELRLAATNVRATLPLALTAPDPALISQAKNGLTEDEIEAGDKVPGCRTWMHTDVVARR